MSSPSVPIDPTLKDPYDLNGSGMTLRFAADMPEIRCLYEQYFQLYQLSPDQPEPTNECRLLLALKLAKAVLEYCFSPSAYSIRATSFNKFARWGLPIQLDDLSEFSMHAIPPNLIGGWYVDRKYEYADAAANGVIVSTTLPHTIFAVIIDDLTTKSRWITNKNALIIPGDRARTRVGENKILSDKINKLL